MRRTRRRTEAGISLQEILMAMAVLGIIAIVAIPNFNDYMKVLKGRTAVNEMVGAINLGRQLTITRREAHIFIPLPSPNNTWQLRNLVTTDVVESGELPPGVSTQVAAAYQFNLQGGCINPTTYSGTTPATQYIQVDALIQSNRTDRYIFEMSAAGRLKTTRTRLTP
jgi:Tfp pilus assembly protein FimT